MRPTSQKNQRDNLFDLRDKLKSLSLEEFRKYFDASTIDRDLKTLINLMIYAYEIKRDCFLEYLTWLSAINETVLDPSIKIRENRNTIQQFCLNGKAQELRQTLKRIPNFHQKYKFHDLVMFALNNKQYPGGMAQSPMIVKHLIDHFQEYSEKMEIVAGGKSLVALAIEKESYPIAKMLLERNVYQSGKPQECQIFVLCKNKWNRKDKQIMLDILSVLFEKNIKMDPRQCNREGRSILDLIQKQFIGDIEQAIKKQESRRLHLKKSLSFDQSLNKQKVKSELGSREMLRHNNELMRSGINNLNPLSSPINISLNSKQSKPLFTLQTEEDELAIRREGNKIYEKYITQKQRNIKVEKMQIKKELGQAKNRIIISEQLKYYLDQEIKYQTQKIKAENNRYKLFYQELISKIQQKLTQYLPITVQIFGSFATSLCLPQSDIDMVIIPTEQCTIHSFHLLQSIHELLLDMKEEVYSSKLIKTASVPIIKVHCTEKYYEKKIDITYRDSNHNGLESVRLIKKYLTAYDVLQPLIFILKKFIYTSSLFSPYNGGISSYGLILMIVAFIQNEYKRIYMEKLPQPMISELLIGFLKFYGFKMDYVKKIICIYDPDTIDWQKYPGCIMRHTDPNYSAITGAPYSSFQDLQARLIIIDPLNSANNVGRSTHKIKQIRMAFEIAFICVHTNRNCRKRKKCELYRRIKDVNVDIRFQGNNRPCCILKQMFKCTDKFIKNDF